MKTNLAPAAFAAWLFAAAVTAATSGASPQTNHAELLESRQRWLSSNEPQIEQVRFDKGGVPEWLYGHFGPTSGDPRSAAIAAMGSLAPIFLVRVDDSFATSGSPITDDLGQTHVRLEQHYRGLKVVGGDLVVHLRSGEVIGVNGRFVAGIDLDPIRELSDEQAIARAVSAIEQEGGCLRNVVAVSEPVIFTLQGDPRMAIPVEVFYQYGEEPHLDILEIDAKTGDVVGDLPQLYSAKFRKIYSLNQQCISSWGELPGTFMFEEGGSSMESAATDAYTNTGKTYDYYKAIFKRDSYDGLGGWLQSSVHGQFPNNCALSCSQSAYSNNAFWWTIPNPPSSGPIYGQMVYGDGDMFHYNFAHALDVTAHEVTHGVTANTAKLAYESESGALNEATSDILGRSAAFWNGNGNPASKTDWTIGNDLSPLLRPLRYMYDPAMDGQSADYYPERRSVGCTPLCANDYCYVHTDSGIANLFYYLLSQGGTHPRGKTTISVPAIGIEKAQRIWYRALTTKAIETTGFLLARHFTVDAAAELFGSGSAEQRAVELAWDAVGVPDDWLGVDVSASPATGAAPLNTTLRASVSGSATGTINYSFWWNCSYSGASVAEATRQCGDPWDSTFGAKFDGRSETTKTVSHTYSTPGTYSVKVIVERGPAPLWATDSKTITVTGGGGGGGCQSSIGLGQPVSGSLTSDCTSVHRGGSYAKYYVFTLGATTAVQIDLTSSVFDTYLFLLNGSGSGGSVVMSDDDSGGNRNSRISTTLNAGTYTIEATSFNSATTGVFNLQLAGGGGPGCSFSINPTSQSFGSSGGNGTVSVAAAPGTPVSAWWGPSPIRPEPTGAGAESGGAESARTESNASLLSGALVDHTMARSVPAPCVRPASVSVFEATEQRAYTWSYYSQVAIGDQFSWEWYRPDGSLYTTGNYTSPYSGSVCVWWWLDIAGYEPATRPGTWSVKVYYNGQLTVTEPFTIRSQTACTWTASSNASWITITSGSSGTGSGTVSFSVAANTGSARTGTMTIAGQTFTVQQSAGGGGGGCQLSIGLGQSVSGSLTSDCASTHRGGSYAKYYVFSVGSTTSVQIDLTSSAFDAYLFLLNGSGSGGSVVMSDDDGGGGTNSRISTTLNAGTYTIEATSYNSGATGAFGLQSTGGGGGLNLTVNQIDPTSCPSVKAMVSVTNSQGQPVTGLGQSNFTLKEDGASQAITVQQAGGGTNQLAVALVLDSSSSLTDSDVANVQQAAVSFIGMLGPSDRVAVYWFSGLGDIHQIQNYTTDKQAAISAVRNLYPGTRDGTALYGAIVTAATDSQAVSGRKALVVMTDGHDENSTATESDAIAAAVVARVPVFSIGFGADAASYGNILHDISSQTGGIYYQGAGSSELQDLLNRIGQVLNNQYILSWTTSHRDGGSHSVEVTAQLGSATDTKSTTYSQVGTPCVRGGCQSSIGLGQSVSGSLTSDCASTHRGGSYAKYYVFSVGSTTSVQIDLTSSAFDAYLFLLNGSGSGGSVVMSDDDSGGNRNSRISTTLNAGTYTIEATSYGSGATGAFGLQVTGHGGGGGVTTIFSEDFEGSFPGRWQLYPAVPATGWGKSTYRKAGGNASAWCAAGGSSPQPAGGPYVANMNTWMVYGPFSLADATDASMEWDHWLDTEANYDKLWAAVSINEQDYFGWQYSGNSSGWQHKTINFRDVTQITAVGASQVWIAFLFQSNNSVEMEGAYIDNVLVKKVTGGTPSCSFSINPTLQAFANTGGTGSVSVTASSAPCPWSASSQAPWITITSGSSGTGIGTVSYSVAANTGGARTGTMTIADQTFTVTQSSGTGGGGGGIYGRVTYQGAAAPQIALTLQLFDGTSLTTVASTTTTAGGSYLFAGIPGLGTGQQYLIIFQNSGSGNPNYLSQWLGGPVRSYTAGSRVAGGDFDIANITLVAPADGVTVPLPQAFSWSRRTATPGDSYLLYVFDPADTTSTGADWASGPLGYVGSYTLSSLPTARGFVTGRQYGWYVEAITAAGVGVSYYYHRITFSGGLAVSPFASEGGEPVAMPPFEPGSGLLERIRALQVEAVPSDATVGVPDARQMPSSNELHNDGNRADG